MYRFRRYPIRYPGTRVFILALPVTLLIGTYRVSTFFCGDLFLLYPWGHAGAQI